MRTWRSVTALAVSVLLVLTGCTSQVSGTAKRDAATAPLTLSKDKYGIVAGFDDAPFRVEIYIEPKCGRCAEFQADFGDAIRYYIGTGQLSVTYRPLAPSNRQSGGYSARVSNALFLAAGQGPAGGQPDKTTGSQFQKFVQQLSSHQDPGAAYPNADEIADLARAAGVPASQADDIRRAETGVDVSEMNDTNSEFLYEIDQSDTATPAIYDLKRDAKIDIYDNNWLSKLLSR